MEIIVTKSDTAIHYELTGNGYPLIMLHGQYMNTTMFNTFDKELLKDYQLIKIDLRGHGRSDKPLHINFGDYLEDVLAVMDELYIKRANFIGYGLGGMVAEAMAIYYPEMVQRLILVSVGNEPFNVSEEKFHMQYANILRTMDRAERNKTLQAYMYKDRKKVANWMKSLTDTETTMTHLEMDAVNHSTDGVDLLAEAHKITAATMMISGQHDDLIKPDNGVTLSEAIKGSLHAVYDNSGHAPMIEEKARFTADVLQFLSPSLNIDQV